MRLHICGARGSTPAPGPDFVRYGGHTSCVAVAHDDATSPTLLVDAGTGLRRVWQLLDGRPFDGSILLGHLHWDHTHGLPFFRSGDDPAARVDLYLPDQGVEAVELLGRQMSPPSFPIRPDQLRGDWRFHTLPEGEHEIEGFRVLAREIPHKGGRTFGYRISDGRTSFAYLSDHHPFQLGPGPDGWGPYHDVALELAGGADLLLHDSQYTDEEFAERAHFGHSTIAYAVGLATVAEVGQLVLFHHDPPRTDDELDRLVADLTDAAVPVTAAAEGDVLDLAPAARTRG
ncbi:MAG: MBL fold metallo-hydrolase [Actinobacteria bacterium]|nr:MBL fold metallo-hydrolase [Actinomycetota bacterium]